MSKKEESSQSIAKSTEKKAFVISPIGEDGSEVRKRSDQILKYVITPVAFECGYTVERADNIHEPGTITRQIVARILKDELVVADLTSHNPNVFYELALRHAIKKPTVQIIEKGEKLPFDVYQSRTVVIDHKDLDSVEEAKTKLRELIKCVEKDPTLVDSPISEAIDLETLKGSKDPQQKIIADLMTTAGQTAALLNEVKDMIKAQKQPSITSGPVFTTSPPIITTGSSPIITTSGSPPIITSAALDWDELIKGTYKLFEPSEKKKAP